MMLAEFIQLYPRFALAFSGGIDSTYLLAAALELGAKVQPYFVKSEFQTEKEMKLAHHMATDLGVELKILKLSALADPRLAANSPERCYLCKSMIFTAIRQAAAKDGWTVVVDGSNASDRPSDRPGMKALSEQEILSPLRQAGLTKEQITEKARQLGLANWNLPANSCLAARILTGQEITAEKLRQIEQAEQFLTELGITGARVRLNERKALIQINDRDFPLLLAAKADILEQLSPFCDQIALDLQPRDGG
ncbi:MAG: ATP-dependent sacrificial sulfur transferase LarE [Clostridiaceae bacterium]|nr:ATP-dependent sacrificial sulfur transferase LarE [Clostridiaceae bacterium]